VSEPEGLFWLLHMLSYLFEQFPENSLKIANMYFGVAAAVLLWRGLTVHHIIIGTSG
jgi:hypothetical protein